jgi:hypothetical protein
MLRGDTGRRICRLGARHVHVWDARMRQQQVERQLAGIEASPFWQSPRTARVVLPRT